MSAHLANLLAILASWGPKIQALGAGAPAAIRVAIKLLTMLQPVALTAFPNWGHAFDAGLSALNFMNDHVDEITKEGSTFFADVAKLGEMLASEIPGLTKPPAA